MHHSCPHKLMTLLNDPSPNLKVHFYKELKVLGELYTLFESPSLLWFKSKKTEGINFWVCGGFVYKLSHLNHLSRQVGQL